MNNKISFKLRGQSLITMAIVITLFVGILAIAIDMGYTYLIRRSAQNAADAGALAGARQICYCDTYTCLSGVSDPTTVARNYAETNNPIPGVNFQTATIDSSEFSTGKIEVTVSANYNTFIASFFGTPEMTLVASAQAGCGGSTAAEGILPIAWDCLDTNITGFLDPACELEFETLDNDCELGEDLIYVFLEEGDSFYYCKGDTPPEGAPNPIEVDCDKDNDGKHDVEPVNALNPEKRWEWVNLNDDMNNASDLKTYSETGYPKPVYANSWHQRKPGGTQSVYDAVKTRENDVVILPVYNGVCQGPDPSTISCVPNPHGWEPGDTIPALEQGHATNSQTWFYRIDMFVPFLINCVQKTQAGSCTGRDYLFPDKNTFKMGSIEGCFVNGFIPGLYHGDLDPEFTGAWTVYMIK